jgi:two-component system nitrate/nitrite response regulator NarL
MVAMAGILVVDDNRLFREGLKCILAAENFRVAAEERSFVGALELLAAERSTVDLVLGNPSSDLSGEFEAVRTILRRHPSVKVVILSDRLTLSWSELALKSGAGGILSHDISTEALRHALNLVLTGEQIVPTAIPRVASAAPTLLHLNTEEPGANMPVVPITQDRSGSEACAARSNTVTPLHRPVADDQVATVLARLSGREDQILECLVQGLSNKLIARHLDMAEATVKVHLKALLRKLKAQNRTQAAIWAVRSRVAAPRLARGETRQSPTSVPAPSQEGAQKWNGLFDRRQNSFQGRSSSTLQLNASPGGPKSDQGEAVQNSTVLMN